MGADKVNAQREILKRQSAGMAKVEIAKLNRSLKKKPIGRPSKYGPRVAEEILERLANGQTLLGIAEDVGITIAKIYEWMDSDSVFAEKYRRARERQAKTLVEGMLRDSEAIEPDRALAVRTRADIVRWVAARYDPNGFGDVKRLELSGEVTHRHVHELPTEQKRRIAESWIISQGDIDTPGISAETSGPALPALEAAGVQEQEEEPRIVPKRKRAGKAGGRKEG